MADGLRKKADATQVAKECAVSVDRMVAGLMITAGLTTIDVLSVRQYERLSSKNVLCYQ